MSPKSLVDTIEPSSVEEGFVEVIVPIEVVEEATMDRGGDSFEETSALDNNDSTDDEFAIMMGACASGGCVGCLVGGPWLACIAGAGSAYGTTRQSPTGDCTRSMGRMALSCRSKAIEVNEKHHVVEKTKMAAVTCWQKSKDVNERHRMMERTKGCLSSSYQGLKSANRKYRISDRTFEGIGLACTYVNDKVIGEASVSEVASINDEPATATAVEQPNEEGESRKPAFNDTKQGPYVVLKTDVNN
jgi:hypothetical protein